MKQVLFSLCVCLSLSACESIPTLSDVENYDWSKLNPLSQSEPVQEVEFANGAAIVGQNPAATTAQQQAALQTELQEMQTLTGVQPTVTPNANGRIPVSAVIGTATPAQNTAPARPQIFMAPATGKPVAPAVFPAKKPVARDGGNVVATASIREATPAAAAPQAPVTSAPTADSIKWNQPAPAPRNANVIPAPAPVPVQQAQAPQPLPQNQSGTSSANQPAAIKGCPRLEIMPVARSMTNFKGDDVNNATTSRASIVDVRGGCQAVKGGLQIDLTLIMKGAITNAGRFNNDSNLEAFITFPYFVSVTSPSGEPIDKIIKATALRFKPKLDSLDHGEQISHFIPMNNASSADQYLVTIGFQLSRKQLEYNNAQTMLRVNNTRNSADMPTARQKSLNPFVN